MSEKWTPEMEREFARLTLLRTQFQNQRETQLLRVVNLLDLGLPAPEVAEKLKRRAADLYRALEPYAAESLTMPQAPAVKEAFPPSTKDY